MDKTKTAIQVFNEYAKQYQDKFMVFDLYNDGFDLFCSHIVNDHADILEIACGPGNITRYLLDKRPGFKILGIDLASNMIGLARLNNPTAEFKLMDCRDIGSIDKKYDAVMCGFCLPYLSKEESIKLISDASGLLKLNGVIYLSTMEDDYSKSGFKTPGSGTGDKIYIHYHQADYLTNALKENGFKIINLQRKPYPMDDGTTTTDLVIIAAK
ncbi:MAG: class I SAM-dependent methyltransferase [Ferruginibacter sp.]|nr:class I SAM-dependent methyltransferase [Ferruginibacter sp.]